MKRTLYVFLHSLAFKIGVAIVFQQMATSAIAGAFYITKFNTE